MALSREHTSTKAADVAKTVTIKQTLDNTKSYPPMWGMVVPHLTVIVFLT